MSVNFSPKLVLIDLDGTLIDTVPDLTRCVDEMMAELSLPLRGEDKVRTWVGNGVERLVRRALTDSMDGEPDEALFERAYPIFLKLYHQHNGRFCKLYDGVKEGLNGLANKNLIVACVTNKAATFTEPLLKMLGIYDYFALVVSGDTVERKKPDPMQLLHAAEHFNIKPEECLMVGDSVNDVKAARAASFSIVCVPYGYNHGKDIRDSNPDLVIDSLAELLKCIQ